MWVRGGHWHQTKAVRNCVWHTWVLILSRATHPKVCVARVKPFSCAETRSHKLPNASSESGSLSRGPRICILTSCPSDSEAQPGVKTITPLGLTSLILRTLHYLALQPNHPLHVVIRILPTPVTGLLLFYPLCLFSQSLLPRKFSIHLCLLKSHKAQLRYCPLYGIFLIPTQKRLPSPHPSSTNNRCAIERRSPGQRQGPCLYPVPSQLQEPCT